MPPPKRNTNPSLDRYLQEIGEVPLLDPAEEIELARRIKKDDLDALEKMTKANLRFVVSVAKQYQNQGLSLGDLINEGNLGLIKAAKRFDETRGFKFISYGVWWIRQSILQALAEQSRVVRLPLNRVGGINKISKKYETLEQKLGREPTDDEIAEELEMTSYEVSDTLKISAKHMSLDAPFKQGEENRLLDVVHDDYSPQPDAQYDHQSLQREVADALRKLSGRESEVIRLYFGLGREAPLTLEEIGEHFSLTRERVRQIKEKAIRRLRTVSNSAALKEFLGLSFGKRESTGEDNPYDSYSIDLGKDPSIFDSPISLFNAFRSVYHGVDLDEIAKSSILERLTSVYNSMSNLDETSLYYILENTGLMNQFYAEFEVRSNSLRDIFVPSEFASTFLKKVIKLYSDSELDYSKQPETESPKTNHVPALLNVDYVFDADKVGMIIADAIGKKQNTVSSNKAYGYNMRTQIKSLEGSVTLHHILRYSGVSNDVLSRLNIDRNIADSTLIPYDDAKELLTRMSELYLNKANDQE